MNPGIDTSTFASDTRAQDDLFRHVNGPWLAATEIAPDRATAGAFMDLRDDAELIVRGIIEAAAASPADADARRIGDLYTSFMDTERIEALGASPLADDLATVAAIDSVDALVRTSGALDRQGVGGLFGLYIAPDRGQPDRYVTHVVQSGIGLPDDFDIHRTKSPRSDISANPRAPAQEPIRNERRR